MTNSYLKIAVAATLVLLSGAALAGSSRTDTFGLPEGSEIDPGSMASAVTLLLGGLVVLRARKAQARAR